MITYIIWKGKFILRDLCSIDANNRGLELLEVIVLTCDNALRIWASTPQNRTTTNRCLVVRDVFFLLPELRYAIAFSNYYGHGFSPTSILLLRCTV